MALTNAIEADLTKFEKNSKRNARIFFWFC